MAPHRYLAYTLSLLKTLELNPEQLPSSSIVARKQRHRRMFRADDEEKKERTWN
jgi:hypothetical protein